MVNFLEKVIVKIELRVIAWYLKDVNVDDPDLRKVLEARDSANQRLLKLNGVNVNG